MKRRDTYSRLADRLPPRKASGGNSIININTGPGASGGYLPLDGTGIMTGNIDVGGNNIANVNLVDGIDISAHAANADAHHAQQHGIISADDHTVTGNALDIIGLTAADTLGKLVPSSAPGAASAILKSSSTGNLTLPTVTATTKITTPTIDTASGNLALSPASGTVAVSSTLQVPTIDTASGNLLLAPASNIVSITNTLQVPTVGTASGNLEITPAGDLILDPAGNDVLPELNYDINLGAINKKYLTLHAAELWVETLVAQETIATIGGRILVGPTNVLEADLATGSTIITVKYNNFLSGDRIYMEAAGKLEFMAITSTYSGTGPYTYTVTRNLDGTGANQWYAGDALFNTGQAGNGWIDLYSLYGMNSAANVVAGSQRAGPTIVGNVRLSGTFNDFRERWAIGSLNGLYDYSSSVYGFAAGDPTAVWVGVDATNGLRMMDATTKRLEITPAGVVNINNSNGNNVITLDNSGNSYFAGIMTIGASGEIRQGTGTLGSNYTGLRIWQSSNIGLIGGYNSDTLQWYADTDGKLYAGGGGVAIDALGVHVSNNNTSEGIKMYTSDSFADDTYRASWWWTLSGAVNPINYLYAGKSTAWGDASNLWGRWNLSAGRSGTSDTVTLTVDGSTDKITADAATFDMTGNITVSGTVDGVDIAAFKAAYDSHTHSYLPLSGGTLTGTLTTRDMVADLHNSRTIGLPTVYYSDIYVTNLHTDTIVGTPDFDHSHAAYVAKVGDTMTGALTMAFDNFQMITLNRTVNANVDNTFFIGVSYLNGTSDDFAFFGKSNGLQVRNDGSTYINANIVWHAGNDGASSGLDADLLDGNHASAFALSSHTHSYLPLSGGTLTGNIVFSGAQTVDGVDISAFKGAYDSHNHDSRYYTETEVNSLLTGYVPTTRQVIAGSGMAGGGALSANITLSHSDTSSVANSSNSGTTAIQSMTFDTYGHVQSVTTADMGTALDGRYVNVTGDTMTGALSVPSSWSTDQDAITRGYIASRGMNLVVNGSGLLSNNYNFSSLTFDPIDTYGGGGSFASETPQTIFSNELIPVDLEKYYRLSVWAKSGDLDGSNYNPVNRNYFGIVCLDADGLIISPYFFMRYSGSALTTLTAPLTTGATTVSLSSASGWAGTNGATYNRQFLWWPYTNLLGYTYPDYTYSRNSTRNNAYYSTNGAWPVGGISGNTITLTQPWPGPDLPAGTPVQNSSSGAVYKYISMSNITVPSTWKRYEGSIGGIDTNNTNNAANFSNGTAFVRVLILPNYQTTGNTIRFSNIWLSEISSWNLESASASQPGVVSLSDQQLGAGTKWVSGNLGVGLTAAPAYGLEVNGDALISDDITLEGAINATRAETTSYIAASFLTDGVFDEADGTISLRMGRSFDSPNRVVDFGYGSAGTFGQQPYFHISPAGVETMRVHSTGFDLTGTATLDLGSAGTPPLDFGGNTTGIYSPSATSLGVTIGGSAMWRTDDTQIRPENHGGYDLGDPNYNFRSLYATNLVVQNLVAKNVIATFGGNIIVSPSNELIADAAAAATSIDVKYNNFGVGEYVYLAKMLTSGLPAFEVIYITSAPTTITGGFRYTCQRNQDGSGANDWLTGDSMTSLRAAAGEGWIELSADNTLLGEVGPVQIFYARTDVNNWDDASPVMANGNLASLVDYSSTAVFGTAAGNDLGLTPTSGFSGFTVDYTSGLRLFNTSLDIYSGGVQTVDIATTGNVKLGSNVSADATTTFDFTASSGVLRVGPLAASKPNLYWDGTNLNLRVNTTNYAVLGSTGYMRIGQTSGPYAMFDGTDFVISQAGTDVITLSSSGDSSFAGVMNIGTSGGIYQGTGSFGTPTTGLKIWNDGGVGRLATYNAGTAQVYFDTNGVLNAGAGNVWLDEDGIALSTTALTSTIDSRKSITFYSSTDSIGRISSYDDPTAGRGVFLTSHWHDTSTTKTHRLTLTAESANMYDAVVDIYASGGSVSGISRITIEETSSRKITLSTATTVINSDVDINGDIDLNGYDLTDVANLAIGTASGQRALHVEAANPSMRLSDNDATTDAQVNAVIEWYRGNNTARTAYIGHPDTTTENFRITNQTTGGHMDFLTNNTIRARIEAGGNVGIGTTSISYKLDVNGSAHASSFPTSSDARFKENLQRVESALDKLCNLTAYNFTWKNNYAAYEQFLDGNGSPVKQLGFLAQDVEQQFPEAITRWRHTGRDGVITEDAYSVDYARMVPLIVVALAEIKQDLEELRNDR